MLSQLNRTPSHRRGTAEYANGRETVERILEAAKSIAINDGFAALSMREVARKASISPGNLFYYYASRDDLVADLLDYVVAGYLARFEELRKQQAGSPSSQLRSVLGFVIDDLATFETTQFFPELWVLANRSEQNAQTMEHMYGVYRAVLEDIIAQMRPDMSARTVKDWALFISASLEGHTVFIGHQRPHRAKLSRIKRLAIEGYVDLIERT